MQQSQVKEVIDSRRLTQPDYALHYAARTLRWQWISFRPESTRKLGGYRSKIACPVCTALVRASDVVQMDANGFSLLRL